MFKFVVLSSSAAVLATGAFAADLPKRTHVELPPAPPSVSASGLQHRAPVMTWAGYHVGIFGSWSNGTGSGKISRVGYEFPGTGLSSPSSGSPTVTESTSATNLAIVNDGISRGGGLFFGANLQSGWFVAGVEADLTIPMSKKRGGASSSTAPSATYDDTADSDEATPATSALNATTSHRRLWDGSVRARVGVLLAPEVLLFGTGGIAIAKFDQSAAVANTISFLNSTASTDATHEFGLSAKDAEMKLGWTLGGGVEVRLSSNLLMRTEYRYADFGKDTYVKRATATCTETTAGACTTLAPGQGSMRAQFNNSFHAVRVGIAYQFASTDGRIAAR